MKHHPHHENYEVLTAAQAKSGADGDDNFQPGYTAGRVANQILQALVNLEFRPWMRIEGVEASVDSDDFQYAISYVPAFEDIPRPYVQNRPQRGINRFI